MSIDVLRSRQAHPEIPPTSWWCWSTTAPRRRTTWHSPTRSGLALLVVLESLGPSERLAFVLHDLFAVPFHEIGTILGKSADATKMLASRARKKVRPIDLSRSPWPTGASPPSRR